MAGRVAGKLALITGAAQGLGAQAATTLAREGARGLCTDINGDGHLDVVTANYRERSMSLLFGRGDGTFKPGVTTPKGLRSRGGRWVAESD